jgi:hypothetical protein
MSQFSAPGGSGGVALADLLGHAAIIRPTSHEPSIPTSFGDKDAIRVDVADLTSGEYHPDALWFSGSVIGALKGRIGQLVLAQVAQGDAKPGQSPPWRLIPLTDNADVVAAAEAWLAANPGLLTTEFTAPATTATTPPAPALAPTVAPAAPVI